MNGQGCNPSARGPSTIRLDQILTSLAWDPPYSSPAYQLTAPWVYANKADFKILIKQVDYAMWAAYSGRNMGSKIGALFSTDCASPSAVGQASSLCWLPKMSIKQLMTMTWGAQGGQRDTSSAKSLHENLEMEIESVEELPHDFSGTAADARTRQLGGGCRRKLLFTGPRAGEWELDGGAPCPPPPPSQFPPQIFVTYYYTLVPQTVGFSSNVAARNSFKMALTAGVNPLPGADTSPGYWWPFSSGIMYNYQYIFKKYAKGYPNGDVTSSCASCILYIPGLAATGPPVVSEAFASLGPPSDAPTLLPGQGTSGLHNSGTMPFYAYIFVVLFLLLALGVVYFFCHKKSKILEAKLDDTFFTGKKQDEDLLKAQAKQQEATLARFEQQLMSGGPPPPPGMSPHLGRKSFAGEAPYPPPPHMDPRLSVHHGARRASQNY
jgi:hypothetical protein